MNRNNSGSRLDNRDSILCMGKDFSCLHFIQIATRIHPACNKIYNVPRTHEDKQPEREADTHLYLLTGLRVDETLFRLSHTTVWCDS
jgi:hypothetical protein